EAKEDSGYRDPHAGRRHRRSGYRYTSCQQARTWPGRKSRRSGEAVEIPARHKRWEPGRSENHRRRQLPSLLINKRNRSEDAAASVSQRRLAWARGLKRDRVKSEILSKTIQWLP